MFSINSNPDIKSYLKQAEGIFGQIEGFGEASTYVNSVWDIGSNINNIANGNEQQKASAIQGLINNLTSLIEKIANKEANAARREVQQNKKAAEAFNNAGEESRSELTNALEEISGEIENQTGVVTDSVKELEKANKEIEKSQEKINKIIVKIQEKQQELANTQDPKEQAKLLQQIQGLSAGIIEITASVADIQARVESASSNVENAVTEIETAKGNSVEITEDHQMKIQQLALEGAQNLQQNVQTQATGTVNNATGQAAQAAAEAASSNVISGTSVAPKLYQVANDQQRAGSTRTTGAVTNLRSVLQGIGGLTDNLSLLTTFNTSIGGALQDFAGHVGSWNTYLEPTIESIGSFSTIQGEAITLQENVKTDVESIGYEINEKGKVEKAETEETQNVNSNETSELLTPNATLTAFELKKKA